MAATLEHCVLEIRKIQDEARRSGRALRPRWPVVILRSPKGWTAPRQVDGHYLEGFWRAHQVPTADIAAKPEPIASCWKAGCAATSRKNSSTMRGGSYRN